MFVYVCTAISAMLDTKGRVENMFWFSISKLMHFVFMPLNTVENVNSKETSWKVAWCTENFSLLQLKCSETHATLHEANSGDIFYCAFVYCYHQISFFRVLDEFWHSLTHFIGYPLSRLSSMPSYLQSQIFSAIRRLKNFAQKLIFLKGDILKMGWVLSYVMYVYRMKCLTFIFKDYFFKSKKMIKKAPASFQLLNNLIW